ncbi:MAG: hypothetical protein EBT92_10040 [Planctomycetes bacterium]|nr:hypothetical protein [Planctomycetota bacterium]
MPAADILLTIINKKIEEFRGQILINREKFISNLKVDLLRLNNSIQKPSDIKSGYNQSIQKIIGQFKSLFRTQMDILQCDCIFSFLQSINFQITDHAKELSLCKTKLLEINNRIPGHHPEINNKHEDTTVFSSSKILSESEIHSIDNIIQETIVKDFGAFTQIFIGSDSLLNEFEKIILLSISTYMKNSGKLIKGNILDSIQDLSSKINFIKSYIASVQHRNLLHSNTTPNQTIFSFPPSILGEWNSIEIFGPTNQSIYFVPGNDDFISCICEENTNLPSGLDAINHFFEIQQEQINVAEAPLEKEIPKQQKN